MGMPFLSFDEPGTSRWEDLVVGDVAVVEEVGVEELPAAVVVLEEEPVACW